jgi:hypothetical protein
VKGHVFFQHWSNNSLERNCLWLKNLETITGSVLDHWHVCINLQGKLESLSLGRLWLMSLICRTSLLLNSTISVSKLMKTQQCLSSGCRMRAIWLIDVFFALNVICLIWRQRHKEDATIDRKRSPKLYLLKIFHPSSATLKSPKHRRIYTTWSFSVEGHKKSFRIELCRSSCNTHGGGMEIVGTLHNFIGTWSTSSSHGNCPYLHVIATWFLCCCVPQSCTPLPHCAIGCSQDICPICTTSCLNF